MCSSLAAWTLLSACSSNNGESNYPNIDPNSTQRLTNSCTETPNALRLRKARNCIPMTNGTDVDSNRTLYPEQINTDQTTYCFNGQDDCSHESDETSETSTDQEDTAEHNSTQS